MLKECPTSEGKADIHRRFKISGDQPSRQHAKGKVQEVYADVAKLAE
jgi:hypothetical protein